MVKQCFKLPPYVTQLSLNQLIQVELSHVWGKHLNNQSQMERSVTLFSSTVQNIKTKAEILFELYKHNAIKSLDIRIF